MHNSMDAHLQKPLFNLFCFTILLLVSGNRGVEGDSGHQNHRRLLTNRHLINFRPNKLFVFGDSYADTGNNPISAASSWKTPYGVTFPGKPAGRFSDGRVLTDYLAEFLGVKSPIPYRWRKVGYKQVKYGMNFANGGTGVFATIFPPGPNMTTQIDLFQQVINVEKVYTQTDIQSSVALVTLSGNDYSTYLARNGSFQGLQALIPLVVNQLAINLDRIQKIGIQRIALTGLQPLGCLPRTTVSSSFQQCNDSENALVNFHNSLLQQAVAKLNNNRTKDAPFVILDLYTAFMTVFQKKGGSSNFQNPLKPCCVGVSSDYSCGSVDDNGERKYTVCNDPKSAFFWDGAHPSQAGWRAVYSALETTLEQIY